jgi:DNA polymerase-3 subunit alpha
MAAMLTSVMGSNEKVAFYINACKKMGINVLPPDINESNVDFSVADGKIRFGLAAIKNVGKGAIYSIITSRRDGGSFSGFIDLCERVNLSEVYKRAVESMIKAGAFDSLGFKRAQLLNVYDRIMDSIISDRKKTIEGQISLFSLGNDSDNKRQDDFPDIKEFDKKYLLAMEKDMLGLYISGHPLDEFQDELDTLTNTKISELINIENDEGGHMEYRVEDGQRVIVGGIVSGVKIKATKNNDIMAFVTLEDVVGSIEVLVFPKTYHKCGKMISEDSVIVIKGRVSVREEEQPKIIAEDIEPLKKINTPTELKKLYIRLNDGSWQQQIEELRGVLESSPGNCPLYIILEKTRKKFMAPRELWVNITERVVSELEKRIGNDNVKVN